jgi:hypothetical protein
MNENEGRSSVIDKEEEGEIDLLESNWFEKRFSMQYQEK